MSDRRLDPMAAYDVVHAHYAMFHKVPSRALVQLVVNDLQRQLAAAPDAVTSADISARLKELFHS